MAEPPDAAATLQVRAHPRAGRDQVGPVVDGVLHVRVVRPAADGDANRAIGRLLAEVLGTAPSRIRLLAGERARHKRFGVDGMSPGELAARLARLGLD